MQIVINAKRNVVRIVLQIYFVVQDVLHEIRDIDMNMGAGTPAKKPKFFWLGKVRLFPYLAERFNSTTRRKEKENATYK